MINQSTIELLRAMKLPAMANELEKQLQDSVTYSKLGFEDRLGLLVDCEWSKRQQNKLNHLIRSARFSDPNASIEAIEYYEDRKLDKAEMIRFATCDYIVRVLAPGEINHFGPIENRQLQTNKKSHCHNS